jgi:transposase InsO family protein
LGDDFSDVSSTGLPELCDSTDEEDDDCPQLCDSSDEEDEDCSHNSRDCSDNGAFAVFGNCYEVGGNLHETNVPVERSYAVVLMFHPSQAILSLTGIDSDRVLVDGGATIHATPKEHLCFDISPCSVSIAGVSGVAFKCLKKGKLAFLPESGSTSIVLTDVHIAAEFPTTFISESAMVKKGCSILKNSSGGAVTSSTGALIFNLEEKEGLYYALGKLTSPPKSTLVMKNTGLPSVPFHCNDSQAALTWLVKCDVADEIVGDVDTHSLLLAKIYSKRDVSDLLGRYHRRMSHISFKRVALAFGIKLPPDYEPPLCNACVIGQQRNVPHHEGAKLRATRACAGLHIDFCGPFPHVSRYGSRYLLIFKCDFTGFVWDFYTKSQSEFFDIFTALVVRLSNQFSLSNVVIWIRSDNGKVFTEGRLADFCLAKGIRQEFSAPYSQWQNGSAEIMFQIIMNLAVSALHQSGLVHTYWEDAVRLAVLCLNRIGEPAKANIEKGFPEAFSRLERLHGVPIPTRLNGIYPLGVLAYARVPQELRRKFEARAVPCIYLGLHSTIKGARLLEMDTNKVTVSAVFTISEGHFPLMISTVATASKEFLSEHSIRDVSESPSVIWPSLATNSDLLALNGPRIARAQPPPPPTRPSRQWTPSPQALQNIAAAADAVDRRTHAGGSDHPEVEQVDSASVMLAAGPDVSSLCFLNPVTPWIFESDDFLADQNLVVAQVLTVASAANTHGLPCDRHEYLALTPTTHARAVASPHAQ